MRVLVSVVVYAVMTLPQDRSAKRLKLDSQGETVDETADAAALKEEYERLLSKKKSLQSELESVMPDRLASTLILEVTDGKLPDIQLGVSKREILVRASKMIERQKHDDILWAYRLTGLSAKVERTSVRLTIETSHGGQYFEPFYVELKFSDKIHLGRHTVPYFIPLKSIARSHLNSNMKLFISTLSRYLNAYVARRQQAYDTQQKYKDVIAGQMESSYAVDYIHFTLKPMGGFQELVIRLLYGDLDAMLPDKVKISPEDMQEIPSGVRRWCRQQKILFKELHLPEAVHRLIMSSTNNTH